MSAYAISTAALSHLRPLVENIVDQNVKEIRRSSSYIGSPEEQKHLNYIADTMESSVQTATRALDCKGIIQTYTHSMYFVPIICVSNYIQIL